MPVAVSIGDSNVSVSFFFRESSAPLLRKMESWSKGCEPGSFSKRKAVWWIKLAKHIFKMGIMRGIDTYAGKMLLNMDVTSSSSSRK
jgi:hypothetical protein